MGAVFERESPGSSSRRKVARMQVCHAREQYIRWLLVTRDLSPHTVRAYDSDIAALEGHLGIGADIGHLDRHRLVAFLEEQREAGLSPASVRRRTAGLRGFCKWLVASRLLDSDPLADIAIGAGRSRRLPRLLRTHELDLLLRSLRELAGVGDAACADQVLCRPHHCTTLLAVSLMVATGARVNEVVSIRCDDVDLLNRSVRIMGKGRRERQVFLTNAWIQGLTRAYLITRTALEVEHAQLLFNRTRRPLTAPAMRSRLVKAARTAGVGRRVTPHMLRHTAATQLVDAGVDIRYIQRLLGHASLTTTEIYTHVSDRALRRVVSEADVLGRVVSHR
jgi:site-specific recombinase XerD